MWYLVFFFAIASFVLFFINRGFKNSLNNKNMVFICTKCGQKFNSTNSRQKSCPYCNSTNIL